MAANALDLALALRATGINLPEAGQEGAIVTVANPIAAGRFFEYTGTSGIFTNFATHAARDADATVYGSSAVGKLARVTSDGTLWQLTNHSPTTWSFVAGTVASESEGSVSASGGTQVTDLALENGYSYVLAVIVRATDGSSGVEFLDHHVVHAHATGGAAAIQAQGQSLSNFATDWSTALSVSTANVRATVTNDTGNARNTRTEIQILRVSPTP